MLEADHPENNGLENFWSGVREFRALELLQVFEDIEDFDSFTKQGLTVYVIEKLKAIQAQA